MSTINLSVYGKRNAFCKLRYEHDGLMISCIAVTDSAHPEFSSGDEALTTNCPLQVTDKGPGTCF